MYSPKIAEDLVRRLYWIGQKRKMRMTQLVDSIIREALDSGGLATEPRHSTEPADIAAKPDRKAA